MLVCITVSKICFKDDNFHNLFALISKNQTCLYCYLDLVFLIFYYLYFRQIEVTLGNQLIECQECHSLYHQVRYLILIWYL